MSGPGKTAKDDLPPLWPFRFRPARRPSDDGDAAKVAGAVSFARGGRPAVFLELKRPAKARGDHSRGGGTVWPGNPPSPK